MKWVRILVVGLVILVMTPVVLIMSESLWHQYELFNIQKSINNIIPDARLINNISIIGNFSPSDNCDYFVAAITREHSPSLDLNLIEQWYEGQESPESPVYVEQMSFNAFKQNHGDMLEFSGDWPDCEDCSDLGIVFAFDIQQRGVFDVRCL